MVFYKSEFQEKFIGEKKYFDQEFILAQVEKRNGIHQDLYERALNGLEYLDQLRDRGLDPIFKGGSAVQLLIPEGLQRLSIDIDLAINASEEEITSILKQIYNRFNKKIYNFQRVGGVDLPSYLVLYNIYIPSLFSDNPSKIELDFLLHEPNYEIQNTPIKTFLYESKYSVRAPTKNALLGDKLTVICPNTIGKKMDKNPLNFAKQLYNISLLLEYSDNLEEIYNAFHDVFGFEKKRRSLPELNFKSVISDLIDICKLFSLTQHSPDWIEDKTIKNNTDFLKRGITGLFAYTSSRLKLSLMKTRTIAAKIAFLGKFMLFQHEGKIEKPMSMKIFQQENQKIKDLIQDEKFINKIVEKLSKIKREEKYHLQLKEMKKIDPIGLIFWFGSYFPHEFSQVII